MVIRRVQSSQNTDSMAAIRGVSTASVVALCFGTEDRLDRRDCADLGPPGCLGSSRNLTKKRPNEGNENRWGKHHE